MPQSAALRRGSGIRRQLLLAAIGAFAALFCANGVWAQDSNATSNAVAKSPPTDTAELGSYVLANFESSRRKLNRGEYAAAESAEVVNRRGRFAKWSAQINGVMDYEQQRFRYDYQHEFDRNRRYKAIVTDAESYLYTEGTGYVSIRLSKDLPIGQLRKPFDIRNAGISSIDDLLVPFDFSQLMNVLRQGTFTNAEKVADEQFVVTIEQPGGLVEDRIWFDGRRDFVPVRYENRGRQNSAVLWGTPMSIVQTEWVEQSGYWLPSAMQIAERNSPTPRAMTLSYHWKSINADIAATHFQWRAFNPPNGTRVMDSRGESAELIEEIGGPSHLRPLTPPYDPGPWGFLRWWGLGASAVLTLFVALYRLRRGHAHSTQPETA